MNKKTKTNVTKYDGTEDSEIKHIAHYKSYQQYLLLIILIVLFGFTFFSTLTYASKYYQTRNRYKDNAEIVEIRNKNERIVISNSGNIYKMVTEEDMNEDIKLENIDVIELSSEKGNDITTKYFDIRYNISENTFINNAVSTSKSDLLVRFAYSFDNKNWTYINNAIAINNSNINPLIGAYYDLSGIIGNVKVVTNYELKTNPNETVKMYWKSETIIKNNKENIGKTLKANFKVEYNN